MVTEGQSMNLGTVLAIQTTPAGNSAVIDGNSAYIIGGYEKTVFITSRRYDGDLNGVSGADQKCNDLATAAGLEGHYKAWLSTSSADSPAATFNRSPVAYVLVDGRRVADNWSSLNRLTNAILLDETGKAATSWSSLDKRSFDWRDCRRF
jgi:hypothetical protein